MIYYVLVLTRVVFGDVITYSFGVEEQSRGELHCHFLPWVKYFDVVMKSLSNKTRGTNLKNHDFLYKNNYIN